MTNPMKDYCDASEAFFGAMLDARADKLFVETMRTRADKIARDIYRETDEHVTDILKGQLSICYELADGIVEARRSREGNASPEEDGGFRDEP